MNAPLRILLVEDNPDDELLICRALKRGGLEIHTKRVETRDEFLGELDQFRWDLVIADYYLPNFGGMEALALLKARDLAIPFILISGTIGEDIAVESIHAGADDYLLKHNLVRLVPAVTRAIRESTERRNRNAAERALVESREQLELIFNSVSDFLVFLSRDESGDWICRNVNRAFVNKMNEVGFPIQANDLMGISSKYIESVVLPIDPHTLGTLIECRDRAVASRKPAAVELPFSLPHGEFVGHITFIPTVDATGDCRHFLVDTRDVTAQRLAEKREREIQAKVTQAQRLESLGTLASGIAHDFNNLLTGIFGFAELASLAKNQTDVKHYCDQITKVSTRARELIRRILSFASPRATNHEPASLSASVRELVPLAQVSHPKNIELDLRITDDRAIIQLDSDQIPQVFLNLWTNAIQAMPEGGRLTIAVDELDIDAPVPAELYPLQPGRHARLTVEDTGCGMSPETVRRIFDPFFTTKPSGQGTGLGLATVHRIVQSQQGAIRVESEPGRGSKFEVYFPQATTRGDVVSPSAPPVPSGDGKRILCVDDEGALAIMAADLLKQLGYEAIPFDHPEQALAAFMKDPRSFAAVVTDNRMPPFSGVELACRLIQADPDLPIVLVTGAIDPGELNRFQSVTNGLVLAKPYSMEQLAKGMEWATRRIASSPKSQ